MLNSILDLCKFLAYICNTDTSKKKEILEQNEKGGEKDVVIFHL